MRVPILAQGQILVASIQSALSDEDLVGFRTDLLRAIGERKARGVVIDLGALDVLDSFASRTLQGIAEAARLRGARTVMVGIQPEVAIAMVRLGLSLTGIHTALDLEDGMAFLRRAHGEPPHA